MDLSRRYGCAPTLWAVWLHRPVRRDRVAGRSAVAGKPRFERHARRSRCARTTSRTAEPDEDREGRRSTGTDDHRPRVGRASRSSTRRCRSGGCGRSTRRSPGRWSSVVLYPSCPGSRGYLAGMLRLRPARRAAASRWRRSGRAARRPTVDQLRDGAARRDQRRSRAAAPSRSPAARVVFADNCAPCHGLGGAGQGFYPTLADDDWLWGGALEDIQQHHPPRRPQRRRPETRDIADAALRRRLGMLTREQIERRRRYVLSLSAAASTTRRAVARGAALFAEQLRRVPRRGRRGQPGARRARLTDAIWLYGGDAAALVAQIGSPRHGVMPAWAARLDPATIKMPRRLRPRAGRRRSERIEACAAHGGDGGRRGRGRARLRGGAKQDAALRRTASRSTRRRSAGRSGRIKWAVLSVLPRALLPRAVAALGPRPGRAGPGGAGRHAEPAALFLLASRSGRRRSIT